MERCKGLTCKFVKVVKEKFQLQINIPYGYLVKDNWLNVKVVKVAKMIQTCHLKVIKKKYLLSNEWSI